MIYRPFHFEYAKKIIKTYLNADVNILVNHFNKHYSKNEVDNITRIDNLPAGAFKMTRAVKKIKNQLLELAKTNQPVTIFIPHTLAILSNYSIFTLAKKYKNVRINIFYEGIIVFYDYEHDYLKHIGYYISRWLAGFISGISYTMNKRLLDFYDPRIHKIYTPFLNINAPKEKLVKTSLDKINYVPDNDTCVILGLKLENEYDSEVSRIIHAIYNKLDALKVTTVFFKDHPSEKNEMFEAIAKEQGKTLSLIHDTSPIEDIIGNYKPKYIISIWSSGLINLSSMLPQSAEIYCFVTEKITEKPEIKGIITAFAEQNINVIYV